MKMSESETTSG